MPIPESKCVTCSKATPLLCDWINSGDRAGTKMQIRRCKSTGERLYTVTECQRYEAASLPLPAWQNPVEKSYGVAKLIG